MKENIKVQFGEKTFFQEKKEFIKLVEKDPKFFLKACEKGLYAEVFKDRDLVVEILYALDYASLNDPRLYDIIFRNNIKETLKQEKLKNPKMSKEEKNKYITDEFNTLCILCEDCKSKQKLFEERYRDFLDENIQKDDETLVDELLSKALKFNVVEYAKEDKSFNK